MTDLLWYHFILDLVGGSNGLLGYKNKTYNVRSALTDDESYKMYMNNYKIYMFPFF